MTERVAERESPDDRGRRPPQRVARRRRLVACCILAVAAAGGVGWWRCAKPKTELQIAEPPIPDLRRATRPVVEIIASHRDEVLRQPNSGKAWGELGMVLFAHQCEAEAATCFEQAQALEPQEYRWPYLTAMLLGVSDTERAEREYRRALELKPAIPTAKTRLGELLLAAERYDEADELFADALRQDERDVRARLGRARVLLHRGDVRAALEVAEEAARRAPETREVQALLAQLYHRAGDEGPARRAQMLAVKYDAESLMWNDPLAAEVLSFRRDIAASIAEARLAANEGRLERAVEVLAAAVREDDRNSDAFIDLGHYLIQLRRLDAAQSILAQGVERHPSAVELRFKLAVIASLRGKNDEAARQFQAVIATNPEHALAHYNLGHLRLQQAEEDEALALFLRTIQLRPDYADAHFHAARVLIRQGKNGEAAEHLKTVLQIRPGDANARKLLTTIP